jgi:hypothetical protein
MKQLNLHFSKDSNIEVIVVNLGLKYKVSGIKNNNNMIFVEGSESFYQKIKNFAELSKQYSEESWDVIDYGFELAKFNFFKKLIKAAA